MQILSLDPAKFACSHIVPRLIIIAAQPHCSTWLQIEIYCVNRFASTIMCSDNRDPTKSRDLDDVLQICMPMIDTMFKGSFEPFKWSFIKSLHSMTPLSMIDLYACTSS
jgi:hypothetical protein